MLRSPQTSPVKLLVPIWWHYKVRPLGDTSIMEPLRKGLKLQEGGSGERPQPLCYVRTQGPHPSVAWKRAPPDQAGTQTADFQPAELCAIGFCCAEAARPAACYSCSKGQDSCQTTLQTQMLWASNALFCSSRNIESRKRSIFLSAFCTWRLGWRETYRSSTESSQDHTLAGTLDWSKGLGGQPGEI